MSKRFPEYIREQKFILFLTFSTLLIIISLYGYIEYRYSEKELLDLLEEQTHALMEAILTASENTLLVNNYLEKDIHDELVSKALLFKNFYSTRNLSAKDLKAFGEISHLFRISIHDSTGKTLLSNLSPTKNIDEPETAYLKQILQPVFHNGIDTLYIGLRPTKNKTSYRYAVALKLSDNQALLINEEATPNMALRNRIGFGRLLRKTITENERIIYAVFQSATDIIAASGSLPEIQSIADDSFLNAAYLDSLYDSRIILFNNQTMFEAVHPLSDNGQKIGLLRLGMSTQPLTSIRDHVRFRLVVMSSVLFLAGFFVLLGGFARQRLQWMHTRYQSLETFTGDMIRSVGDAILVWNDTEGLRMANPAFYELFHLESGEILPAGLSVVFSPKNLGLVTHPDYSIGALEVEIKEQIHHLLISKTTFSDRNGRLNFVFIMRDMTLQKRSEEQIHRKERLTAMGELASGVAHEIRNPLNAIGTIAQQLVTDFESTEDKESYKKLTGLIYSEVKRINKTVRDFLEFARPLPINRSAFGLASLFGSLETQYRVIAGERHIDLEFLNIPKVQVNWDFDQIKQVLINLIENAIEASKAGQKVQITATVPATGSVKIRVSDQGSGIPEKNLPNIFNLYFTTKAKGTGIGLSISQRIVFEHGGTILASNNTGGGALFELNLPQN